MDSGDGFSRNDVTSPELSTSSIPNLCVSEKSDEKCVINYLKLMVDVTSLWNVQGH